jgi:peptidoglycan/xylan/chitin deacetylase (PgdA/CDA1 family)
MSRALLAIDEVMGAGIMFHHFHGAGYPAGQGSINADQFADLIEFVGRKRILDASEWQTRANAGHLERGDLCICFDDGLACQGDIALPVLDAYDICAFWFVYTSPLEGEVQRLELYRYYRDVAFDSVEDFYAAFDLRLSASEWWPGIQQALKGFQPYRFLQEYPFYTDSDRRFRFLRDHVLGPERYFILMDAMIAEAGYDPHALSRSLFLQTGTIRQLHADGHRIGLHSHTHPTRLEALDSAAQAEEYLTNRRRLEAHTGEPVTCMSHPCNSYNEITLTLLGEMGIEVGFRSNMYPVNNPGRMEYPREDHANLMREMSR